MNRDRRRLADIEAACLAIQSHLAQDGLESGTIFDAVRVRLIEIGEAVKDLSPDILATEPDIPWRQIARMRDHLVHRYFDTSHALVQEVVDQDIEPLSAAVQRMSAEARGQ